MDGTGATESSNATTTPTATEASSSGERKISPGTHEQPAGSVVQDLGVYSRACGYCNSSWQTMVQHYIWACFLTVQDYQELIDRGWLRSGMLLIKPRMLSACCPRYAIRLRAESFVATKNQMRVLRRMQRYLEGKLDGRTGGQTVGELQEEKDETYERLAERASGLPNDNHLASASQGNASDSESLPVVTQPVVGTKDILDRAVMTTEEDEGRLKAATETALKNCIECGSLPLMDLPTVSVKRVPPRVQRKLKNPEGGPCYTSNISFAVMALLKRRAKSEIQGDEFIEQKEVFSDMKPEEIAELLVGKMPELKAGCEDTCIFTVEACKGHINFKLTGRNISSLGPLAEGTGVFQGRSKRKVSNEHKRQPSSSTQSSTKPPAMAGTLEVRMKRSSFDAEEFSLYKRYQVTVHNDLPEDVTEDSYRKFLVDTPLIFVEPVNDGTTPSCGFGSFHEQFLLDGKIVAVGVIDILPHCLSSTYLFWDPDFAFLSLGKYSALQEIKWVQEAQTVCSSLQYYCLGLYVHSCPKMWYKLDYYPSELLCPERFNWVPCEMAVPFLLNEAYVCLSDIADFLSVESTIPAIARQQESGTDSAPAGSEEEENGTEVAADFPQFEDPENVGTSFDLLFDHSTERLGNIRLYANGECVSFKHFESELAPDIPQEEFDALVHNLNRYLQAVGPCLASRMAYALS